MTQPHAFADLTPDSILDAVESIGFRIDASLLELNSYENRVYQIGIEDKTPIIAKFYRAERWSDAEINEEHAFSFDLFDEELSVVPPIQAAGQSLFHYEGLRFSLFKRQGGRAPPVDDLSCLETLGRHIAMIHNVGQRKTFACRPTFSVTTHGHDAVRAVLEGTLLPASAQEAYEAVTTQLLAHLDQYEGTSKRSDSGFMAIVIWATYSGATTTLTSLISTTHDLARRYRIYGCCYRVQISIKSPNGMPSCADIKR